jgi:class 3 adenylate cyclase
MMAGVDLPIFSAALRRTIARARHCVYLTLAGLLAMSASPRVALGLVAASIVLHLLCRRVRGLLPTLVIHLVENALILLVVGSLPLAVQYAVLCSFLAANAALFGRRHLALFVAATLPALASGPAERWLEIVEDPTATLSLAWVLGFAVTISLIAHRQAHSLLHSGARIKSTNRSLLRYLPREVVRHLKRNTAAAPIERQWMTVVFVDLVGFTGAARAMPAESLYRVVNDFFASADAHARAWGGSVSKFVGDGVLIAFASEVLAGRANMARQCRRCIDSLDGRLDALRASWKADGIDCPLTVTSGIASGYCAVGEWGGGERRDFTVIGTPVNLAARLQVHAEPGGALMDATTASLLGETRNGRRIEVKGFGPTLVFAFAGRTFAS